MYDNRVRLIIPPTNNNRDLNGLLKDGNALSKDFNDFLKKYLNNYELDKTYLIFIENPPFRDETSTLTNKDKKSKKTKTYVDELMSEDPKIKGAMKNELSIKFIWSAWNIFTPNEYILYSPIKYWKINHIFDKKYYGGFITDKKDYNANYNAGLPIINWSNEDANNEVLNLENGKIKKIHYSIKTLLDKTKNDNWISKMFIQAGEIRPIGTSLDNGNQVINDTPALLDEKNILNQLPLWCAAKYETKDLELNILMKGGDGLHQYLEDTKFLNDCFIWSCLSQKNKCVSNIEKINEMALLQESRADKILEQIKLNSKQKELLNRWKKVLELAKEKDEFDDKYKYGLNQLEKEINVKICNGSYNKKGEEIWEFKYPDLRDQIKYLKIELKRFYTNEIENKIMKYELIK